MEGVCKAGSACVGLKQGLTGAGLQQTLHQKYQGQSNPCMTGKRADTHGYVAEGTVGGLAERGEQRCAAWL